jgi:SAM-dependent methyltransferase
MHRDSSTPPDLLAVSRQELVETHVIHEFGRERVLANLAGCYGEIMKEVYSGMLSFMKGRRIIDCGCGFGQFSRVAIDAGYEVTSIDIDDASLAIARGVSQVPCRKESAYATSLADNSCDTAVCCDSIQHLDIGHLVPEMDRLGVERIVIYDSNIENRFLTRYRELTGHEESNDRTAGEIVREFGNFGWAPTLLRYENFISLPLSGGFQRPPVAGVHRFPSQIHALDTAFRGVARALRLDRRLAFRFLLVLDRSGAG